MASTNPSNINHQLTGLERGIAITRDLHLHILGAASKLDRVENITEVKQDLMRAGRLLKANTVYRQRSWTRGKMCAKSRKKRSQWPRESNPLNRNYDL